MMASSVYAVMCVLYLHQEDLKCFCITMLLATCRSCYHFESHSNTNSPQGTIVLTLQGLRAWLRQHPSVSTAQRYELLSRYAKDM